jgi:Putative Flp pilus-assembly TadE/G-like
MLTNRRKQSVRVRGGANVTKRVPTQKQNLKRFGRAEEGQALVLTALALVVLMLMAGLGVDVGYLRYQKQQMQKAADAGAIAGASALLYGGDWHAAGQNDAAANGFTDGQNGTVVRVDHPWEGPFAGKDRYVEVSVLQPQPTFFMRVGGFNNMPVRSWAVASADLAAGGCVYVLDPKAPMSYKAAGGALVTANCGIYVNSTSGNAFDQTGSGCTKASFIDITGGVMSDSCSQPQNPSTGFPPQADPLAGVAAPTVGPIPGSCTSQSGKITGGTVTLQPGTFCGGISISGTSPNVIFTPGTYILYGGGLQVTSSTAVLSTGPATGGTDGVTFYNTGTAGGPDGFKAIGINGGTVNLTAPTGGTFAGMLFFEDRNPAGGGAIINTITGGSGSTFTGALYFPTTTLNYAGGTASGGYTVVVANQVDFVGNSTFSNDYSSLTGGPLIHGVGLVE